MIVIRCLCTDYNFTIRRSLCSPYARCCFELIKSASRELVCRSPMCLRKSQNYVHWENSIDDHVLLRKYINLIKHLCGVVWLI